MTFVEKLLEAGYKKYTKTPVIHDHANAFYQKRITDEKGTKYFINVLEYLPVPTMPMQRTQYEFGAQLDSNLGHINIQTVAWFFEPNEWEHPVATPEMVEEKFEGLWQKLGSEYYELI